VSVASKHAYRYGFLKSEEWQYLRKLALSRHGAKCYICGHTSWGNDVHHAVYSKDWSKQNVNALFPLCRACHNLVHVELGDKPDYTWKTFRRTIDAVRRKLLKKPCQPKLTKPHVSTCIMCGGRKYSEIPINRNTMWRLCGLCAFSFHDSVGNMRAARTRLNARPKSIALLTFPVVSPPIADVGQSP
jgi:hypothetical protein